MACASDDSTGADPGGSESESSGDGEPGDGDGEPGDGDGDGDPGDGDGDGEPEAVCGDGSVDGDEQCDDGNGNDNDACTNACTLAVCGDGVVGPGEACDLGLDNSPNGNCYDDCTANVCGDGIVGPTEGCDDGNANDADACTNACALATCGDGSLGPGEACDDGNEVEIDACSNLCVPLPVEPGALTLDISAIKQFEFTWNPVFGATYYQILERATPEDEYVQVSEDVVGESVSLTVPLHLRAQASYKLRACNEGACSESAPVDVASNLAEAVGYFKASPPTQSGSFGEVVAISADGSTLAIGALGERAVYVFANVGAQWVFESRLQPPNTASFGVDLALSASGDTLAVAASAGNGNGAYVFSREQGEWTLDELLPSQALAVALSADGTTLAVGTSNTAAGVTYVFVRDGLGWLQEAIIQASNPDTDDGFGRTLALAADGDTLAIGAPYEGSNAVGINGSQADNSASFAGAAYVFVRDGDVWSQQAYVKATNTAAGDYFGEALALSADGETLAVGAKQEDSSASGVNGDQTDNSVSDAGAVYVYTRTGAQWAAQAYVKSPAPDAQDWFGISVALSGDGTRMVVGAENEGSDALGVGGDPSSDVLFSGGAVYVFEFVDAQWAQSSYVKAPNTSWGHYFGGSVALSGDAGTLAVGAKGERSNASGVGGDQTDDSLWAAGAAYLY